MTLINGYEIPSLTNTWHSDTYAAISPLRPELSAKGKTVIITGAGSGIGRETAKAFATAGAEHIALIGRRIANVSETKSIVEAESPSVRVTAHEADVVDLKATVKAAAEIGKWDVLLLNAGYGETPAKAGDADVDDWWKTFEINVKGNMVGVKSFLPTRNTGAVILASCSSALNQHPTVMRKMSGYASSKMAQLKFLEVVAAEYEDVRVMPVHPGVVTSTALARKSGMLDGMEFDTIALPAHYFVWAASPEAAFAQGRMTIANWDVDELKARRDEFKDQWAWTANVIGYPYKS